MMRKQQDGLNRLTSQIDSSLINYLDYAFEYDGLNRLKQYQQGTLSGTTITSGSLSYQELYTLDQLGNWTEFKTGSGSGWYLDQNRYHNAANEIDGNSGDPITASVGANWADPTHDGAGNMITMPQPDWMAPWTYFTLKYDAWNRMTQVKYGADTVQQNLYDGLGRRIVRSVYASGSLSFKIHYYYNEHWQLLEERKEDNMGSVAAHPLNQCLWHPYYIDALAVRWYDASTSGTQTPYYYLQDANFNVTAIANSSGQVVERGQYQAYGRVRIRNGDVDPDGDPWGIDPGEVSDVGNTHWFSGRELDPETGLQLNRKRFYDAPLGRWTTRDDVEYHDSRNLYEYVDGTPVMGNDPSGRICVKCKCRKGWGRWLLGDDKETINNNCDLSAPPGLPIRSLIDCCQGSVCGLDWKAVGAERCDNIPPDYCTIWDVCTVADCAAACASAAGFCRLGCYAVPPGLGRDLCKDGCAVALAGCVYGCNQKCKGKKSVIGYQ